MDDSEFILNTQALNELQQHEIAVLEENRLKNEEENDIIAGSQEDFKIDLQHETLSFRNRLKLATQRKNERIKLGRTKSDTVNHTTRRESKNTTEVSSLSKLMEREMDGIDFSNW